MHKKIPIDVSSFDILRTDGYIYVDKTKQIYNLVSGGRLYFLTRPRRFGKSLLISTLIELFQGKFDLFNGLWIKEHSDYKWPIHPVIHLDFSVMSTASGEALEKDLIFELEQIARSHGFDITQAPNLGLKLKTLLINLSQKDRVVILIDEYDYALVNNIENKTIALEIHAILRSFYSALKGLDKYLKFLLVTGVTKYSKTSLFSGMNNLNDLSFDPRASALLGYSREEITHYFEEELNNFADKQNTTTDKLLEELKMWYDGYRFSEVTEYLYNPFSVLYCLQKHKFANYWFETGAPSFLISLLAKHRDNLQDVTEVELSSSALGPFEIGEEPLIPILFQAGYLSITDYHSVKRDNKTVELYTLKYPNLEVAESFKKYMLAALTSTTYNTIDQLISKLYSLLQQKNIDGFCRALESLLAHIPYQLHIAQEKYYHSLFQQLMTLLSINAESEISTDKGRIDMVIKVNPYVYVFELKLNESAESALKQIEERKYFEKYRLHHKKIILVGLSYKRDKEGKLNLSCQSKELF